MYEQLCIFDYFQDDETGIGIVPNYKIKNKVRLIELFAG